MAEQVSSPFRTLLKIHPYESANFLKGSSTVRQIVRSGERDPSVVLAPLRGALPIIWASEGLAELEDGYASDIVELPIGLFHYNRKDGVAKTTSPNMHQKKVIVDDAIKRIFENNKPTDIWLVDEVQKGGTITQVAKLARQTLDRLNPGLSLRVVAAQDSRKKVVEQQKTDDYRQLSSNSMNGIRVNVIPMPLIQTDKDSMLDTVHVDGDFTSARNFQERAKVIRNYAAERMFRSLGSITRLTELLHDDTYMREFVDSQGPLDESLSTQAELWLGTTRRLFK